MNKDDAIALFRKEIDLYPDTVYAMALEMAIRALERKREFTKIIAVDFDGTLCQDRYPDIGAPTPLLKKAIEEQKNGAAIIMWTCRKGALIDKAVEWCAAHGLVFDAINANLPENIREYGGMDTRKVYADEYWDDKAKILFPCIGDSTVCPYCGSKRIFHFRLDSDWGSGIGDYYPVNEQSEYVDDDVDAERPDIEILHCRNCGGVWNA